MLDGQHQHVPDDRINKVPIRGQSSKESRSRLQVVFCGMESAGGNSRSVR
jgi:hypothetical protein